MGCILRPFMPKFTKTDPEWTAALLTSSEEVSSSPFYNLFLDYLWGELEGNLKISSEGCLLSWWTSRTSSWRPPTDTRASLGLLYSWWRLEDARWALKIDKTLLKSAIFIVFSSFGGVLNMKFDEEQLLFWCESCGRAFCGSKTRFKLWRRLKIPTKFWFRMWG